MADPRYLNAMIILALVAFAVLTFTFLHHGSG
jgi:hypothetical protein